MVAARFLEWRYRVNNQATILIVDDEENQLKAIGGFLTKSGFDVIKCSHGQEALKHIQNRPIDLVISDIRMPEMSGLELQNKAKEIVPDIVFIFMTAYGTIGDAVTAMRNGAFNYLSKPIDLDELEIGIMRALENRRLIAENRQLKQIIRDRGETGGIIYESHQMDDVLNLVARAAPTMATILITGESGTGKERISRAIHYGSPRSEKPMVIVNCAAIPENLLESEMFGYEAGAFTDARSMKKGKLELADQGTLFIDEIGDMPSTLQPKLLRFLQEGTIERIGSTSSMNLNIRVIAATNKNLEQAIKAKEFREDLYFRLNVINIHIPPLRERRTDIIPLAEHFLKIYSRKNSRQIDGFTSEARNIIMKYDYPGNVRELENAIESAVVLTRGTAIGIEDLPYSLNKRDHITTYHENDPLPLKLESFEKRLVLEALRKAGGNKSRAARELGVSEKNIRDRLKKWGYKG